VSYDGLSRWVRLVEKDSSQTVSSDKRFVWEGFRLAEERDATCRRQAIFRFWRERPPSGQKLFYSQDHLGSLREVIDQSGTLLARFTYGPWGERTKLEGPADVDFGFTGHYTHSHEDTNGQELSGLCRRRSVGTIPPPDAGQAGIRSGRPAGSTSMVRSQQSDVTDRPAGACRWGLVGPAQLRERGSELNPFNLSGSFRANISVDSDAMGGMLNVIAGNGLGCAHQRRQWPEWLYGLLEQTRVTSRERYRQPLLGFIRRALAAGGLIGLGAILFLTKIPEERMLRTPVGRLGNPMEVTLVRTCTTIEALTIRGHALDQMQGRGFVPSVVKNTIDKRQHFNGRKYHCGIRRSEMCSCFRSYS